MQRYRVVVFETLFPIWDDQVAPRGGGVAFVPLEAGDWPAVVSGIVQAHFHHKVYRSSEVGLATLDESVLAQFCHRHNDSYWQGGDVP